MNKKYIFLAILSITAIGLGIFAFYKFNNNNDSKNYDASRTSQNLNTSSNNETTQNEVKNPENTPNKDDQSNNDSKQEVVPVTSEKEVSSFTTKIYTKDSDRQNNVTLACSALNDTVVENGKTFSFSNTVGKATTKKGYKKADVFKNGEVIEALGGGLCQVSTTLYNAVLKVPDTKVTERHSHSNKVPYIKSGKDAAVSYGTYDFKFVNNTGKSLKIKADNTPNNITIKILKLE